MKDRIQSIIGHDNYGALMHVKEFTEVGATLTAMLESGQYDTEYLDAIERELNRLNPGPSTVFYTKPGEGWPRHHEVDTLYRGG